MRVRGRDGVTVLDLGTLGEMNCAVLICGSDMVPKLDAGSLRGSDHEQEIVHRSLEEPVDLTTKVQECQIGLNRPMSSVQCLCSALWCLQQGLSPTR